VNASCARSCPVPASLVTNAADQATRSKLAWKNESKSPRGSIVSISRLVVCCIRPSLRVGLVERLHLGVTQVRPDARPVDAETTGDHGSGAGDRANLELATE
jgi:hypothetical protein